MGRRTNCTLECCLGKCTRRTVCTQDLLGVVTSEELCRTQAIVNEFRMCFNDLDQQIDCDQRDCDRKLCLSQTQNLICTRDLRWVMTQEQQCESGLTPNANQICRVSGGTTQIDCTVQECLLRRCLAFDVLFDVCSHDLTTVIPRQFFCQNQIRPLSQQ